MNYVSIKSIEESNELSGVWGVNYYDVMLERNDEAVIASSLKNFNFTEEQQPQLNALFNKWLTRAINGDTDFNII